MYNEFVTLGISLLVNISVILLRDHEENMNLGKSRVEENMNLEIEYIRGKHEPWNRVEEFMNPGIE